MTPSKKQFTLYWSNLELYEDCPQRFLWSRGWGQIDVGGGPGKPKPPPVQESKHHAIMGIAIAKVSEHLYNDELWRDPKGLPERLAAMVEKEVLYELSRKFVDWRAAPPKEEMVQTCKDGIVGFLRTMKENRLLGPYAKAEVEMLGWINKYNPVGGRADLVIRRDDTGTTILDGKNSKSKGKYTDPDQLRWYALLFYLSFGQLPQRLGFIYYRYPYNAETGESGVDWVPFTKDDLKGLAQRAVDARKGMDRERFEARPQPSTCRFCVYETVCPARQSQREANAAKRNGGHKAVAADPSMDGSFHDIDLSGDSPWGSKG